VLPRGCHDAHQKLGDDFLIWQAVVCTVDRAVLLLFVVVQASVFECCCDLRRSRQLRFDVPQDGGFR